MSRSAVEELFQPHLFPSLAIRSEVVPQLCDSLADLHGHVVNLSVVGESENLREFYNGRTINWKNREGVRALTINQFETLWTETAADRNAFNLTDSTCGFQCVRYQSV